MTVGLLDSGIDTGHPMFEGNAKFEQLLSGASDETGESEASHGTAVASVIAASPSNETIAKGGFRGVAWGADIAMFAVPTSPGDGDYEPITIPQVGNADASWATLINSIVNWSHGNRTLDFVNISLGFQGLIDQYSTANLRNNLSATIRALAQSGSGNKTVFIWSAGNANGNTCDPVDFGNSNDICINGKINAKSPQILAGLPARIAELRANSIAVVAVDQSGDIAGFSNRCGIAADWCISAPGTNIRVAYFGPKDGAVIQGVGSSSGTSVAAPMVTGSLIVMKHLFRNQLSNTALVSRLYATANKSGKYSNRQIYGQGLLDLDAATAPVGFTNIVPGSHVNGTGFNLQSSGLNLGNSFGDSFNRSLAGQELVAFDALGAPFWYKFQQFVHPNSGPSLSQRLSSFMNSIEHQQKHGMIQPQLGALPVNSAATNPNQTKLSLINGPGLTDDGGHLALAGRALMMNRSVSDYLNFGIFTTEPIVNQSPVSGMEVIIQDDGLPFTLRSGMVSEQETLLGSTSSGAFGSMAGRSAFAGIEKDARIGPWQVGMGAQIGTLSPSIHGDSVLSVPSRLLTSAIALRTQKSITPHDHVSVSLSQPMRVERGHADYVIPVGRTIEGEVLHKTGQVDLEPSGRQFDFTAQWHRKFSQTGDFRVASRLSLQPGHSSSAKPELTVLAGWRMRF